MASLQELRKRIRAAHTAEEDAVLRAMKGGFAPSREARERISQRAATLVNDIRESSSSGLMELFLAEYGLSTDEGVALMCLAEALLRVPDEETIDALIEDKIAPSSWGEHLGKSSSSLVNASTWALMLSGKLLRDEPDAGLADILHGALKRLGEPVIRSAVKTAIRELGHQFVLGRTIGEAIERGRKQEKLGYTYSYDMLGEAALTGKDATEFHRTYKDAISALSENCRSDDIHENPGISIKLSALHPRYEVSQKARVMTGLVERAKTLAVMAKDANMGLNIDAEEADRLDLSLDVIEALLRDPDLAGWEGFGVVVQGYGKRCTHVIDWLYALSGQLGRKIMVRLVKGAYWDSEIKNAQAGGFKDFPVFTRKAATDVSYICCTSQLLGMTDRIYPQFATHNAHTVAAVLELASENQPFEFQRLHGMGEALHERVLARQKTRCRIYAPVGAHRDLLAYLVRRLLENGANSSFVNQIVDPSIPVEKVAADPFSTLPEHGEPGHAGIRPPADLYAPQRKNSRGWDLHSGDDVAEIDEARAQFRTCQWHAVPLIAGRVSGAGVKPIVNPADPGDVVGSVSEATEEDVETALGSARDWSDASATRRSKILRDASILFEENLGEIFAVLCREAGKTPEDSVAELREAVDFLRYYANEGERLSVRKPCGLITCISPWNFPLAIFTGQIAAALAAGNGVLAKPADPSPLVAAIAVRLLHEAGVPKDVLQLLPGPGSVVGARLTSDPRINGVCFTGSIATAQTINMAMASNLEPGAPLIAETGGLNAMIVDSTALPEQAIRDIIASAFQSAGQRCSALRLLCLQEDIAPSFLKMLFGAMDELVLGNPWDFSTDSGPVISQSARDEIMAHIETARREGRVIKQLDCPGDGHFVGPTVIKIENISELKSEVFGPVLHVSTFHGDQIGQVADAINSTGYGLTFGLHTRIDDRVEDLTIRLKVGNMYINRNQIGAVVGSQPFGGEGLSGTGPKAGGPHYVARFTKGNEPRHRVEVAPALRVETVQAAIDDLPAPSSNALKTIDLPGPTGESNRLSLYPRGVVLCLGPSSEDAMRQAKMAASSGCSALMVAPGVDGPFSLPGFLDRGNLAVLEGFDAVALWSDLNDLEAARQALASRKGVLIPLICTTEMEQRCIVERHVCIDTTASGGNASLLAASP